MHEKGIIATGFPATGKQRALLSVKPTRSGLTPFARLVSAPFGFTPVAGLVMKPSAREWRGGRRQAQPTKAEVKVDAKAVERWARDRGYLG